VKKIIIIKIWQHSHLTLHTKPFSLFFILSFFSLSSSTPLTIFTDKKLLAAEGAAHFWLGEVRLG
jgi:hypothetical protein